MPSVIRIDFGSTAKNKAITEVNKQMDELINCSFWKQVHGLKTLNLSSDERICGFHIHGFMDPL